MQFTFVQTITLERSAVISSIPTSGFSTAKQSACDSCFVLRTPAISGWQLNIRKYDVFFVEA